jgi:hypothetical protein
VGQDDFLSPCPCNPALFILAIAGRPCHSDHTSITPAAPAAPLPVTPGGSGGLSWARTLRCVGAEKVG